MAGHPSVKKRQKEVSRKERQAEKLAKRDERRSKRNDPSEGATSAGADRLVEGFTALELAQLEAGTLTVAAPTASDEASPEDHRAKKEEPLT